VPPNILELEYSAYRRHHSTETAMLRVLSDVLTAADTQKVTLLSLLDLSAAFDCVDHQLLLQRLRHDFGLTDTACLDDVVCHRQKSAGGVQEPTFNCSACAERSPTGVRSWPHTLRLIHG